NFNVNFNSSISNVNANSSNSNVNSNSSNSNIDLNSSKSNKDGFVFLVIGGSRFENHPFAKYVVSLQESGDDSFGKHFCGGSILSKKLILTAAHCVMSSIAAPSSIRIVAGTPRRLLHTNNTQEMEVEQIIVHPQYYSQLVKNDIALIKLKDELDIDDDFVSVLPLTDEEPTIGQECTIIGWGTILEAGPLADDIVSGDVSITHHEYCEKFGGYHRDVKLCISNPKNYEVIACHGDSGGPLICDNMVVGVASYGVKFGYPTMRIVYTNAYYFRDWISQNSVCGQMKIVSFWLTFQAIILALLL
ncbi:hypothetical protein KR093_002065, partial [Drosophila rubida]